MFRSLALSIALLTLSFTAIAQMQSEAEAGGPVLGPLVRYTEESATLLDKDGKEIVVIMTRDWTVSTPRQLSTATIKKGDFVATTNQPIDAHTGRSTELRIFEPGYERDYGTRPMGQNGNVETHGTVSAIKKTEAGVELDVTYPDGSRHLIVPDSLKVTRSEPLNRTVLKPGTTVRAVRLKEADGIYRAGRLTLPAETSNINPK